jgi:4-aminobutyrate aminotransferase-like enzyme
VQRRCLDDGVIVLSCGPDDRVLRLIPALTISDDELGLGLDVLADALIGAGRS